MLCMFTYFIFGREHLSLSPSSTEIQISTHVGVNQDLTQPKKKEKKSLPLIHSVIQFVADFTGGGGRTDLLSWLSNLGDQLSVSSESGSSTKLGWGALCSPKRRYCGTTKSAP